MTYDKDFSNFDRHLKKGGGILRNRADVEAARVLGSIRPYTNDPHEMRFVYSEDIDPSRDPTLEEYEDEIRRRRGMTPPFEPGKYGLRVSKKNRTASLKSMRKSRKVSRKSMRKSRKASRKSMRKSRKASRKSMRKSRKVSRKSMRKSRKASRKSIRKSRKASRKSMRKSRRASRKSSLSSLRSKSRRVSRKKSMGKRERACKDLLKEKVGINLKEYKEDGRYVSRQQAIAVAYSQVKKMKPSCGKYFKRKDN